jgi:hypothetical protein
MNATPVALTARMDRREPPLGRVFILLGSGLRCQEEQKTKNVKERKKMNSHEIAE